jgi:hypothetical protein
VKDAQVEGGKISRTRGKSFEVLLKQGLKIWNPRGERLTPVLLKQGLVLSPPSRQTASSIITKYNQNKRV